MRKSKTYVEKYGVEMVEKHLRNRHGGRYFKTANDYANGGITLFKRDVFLRDIAVAFPIVNRDQNGWTLPKAPTVEEFRIMYDYLTK